MKVLHVIPSLSEHLDGPANAIVKMCNNLKTKGLDITIYTTDLHPINYKSLAGIDVKVFKTYKKGNYCFSLRLWSALNKNIDRYDLVHIHALWVFPTTVAAYIARNKNIPYIVRTCGMLDSYSIYHNKWKSFKKLLYFSVFERRNLNGASAIHFTSSDEFDRSKHLDIKALPLIIPVGIERSEYICIPSDNRITNEYPLLKGKKIILFLSRIHYKKGLELLLDAYEIVLHETDQVYLIIAGPDNEGYKKILEKKINALKLNEKVLFTGLVAGKQKMKLLSDADIFCLPSFQENFGIAVAEAMAAGLPVIVSDQVNICTEISHANAGIVTRCDAGEVASALLTLVRNDSLRNEMGQNGKELVFEKFTWDKIVEDLVKSYKKIVERFKDNESIIN